MDSNHRTHMRTDLQSAAFSHSAICPKIICTFSMLSYYTIRFYLCQYFFYIFSRKLIKQEKLIISPALVKLLYSYFAQTSHVQLPSTAPITSIIVLPVVFVNLKSIFPKETVASSSRLA